MSKKDYELIAKMLKDMRNPLLEYDLDTLDWVAMRISDIFKADNPSFDKNRFFVASDLSPERLKKTI